MRIARTWLPVLTVRGRVRAPTTAALPGNGPTRQSLTLAHSAAYLETRFQQLEGEMKVLIGGSTGMVGSAIASLLRDEGHTVLPLIRPPQIAGMNRVAWNPETGEINLRVAAGTDAVINLAGASIAGTRWTESRKQVLRTSRVDATRKLVDALARIDPRPKVLVSASAVGYFGNRGNEVLTEESAPGDDFLARLARDWEAEALRAEEFGIRTVVLRFGMILSEKGGALTRMLGYFQAGWGGKLGNGKQWMSWISLPDAIGLIRAAILNDSWKGAYNAVAPQAVTNAEFTRTLSHILHKRAMVRTPAMVLRAMFGEMADAMLLASQRVEPTRLIQNGYSYSHEKLEPALSDALTKG